MNKLMLLCFSLILISSALAYYPGEMVNVSNDLNRTDLVYTIIYNSTPINLDINLTNEFVWFTIPYDITPQEFTIIFIEEQTNEVVLEVPVERIVYRGGGGSRTIIKEVNNTVYLNDTRYYPIETECNDSNKTSEKVPQEIEKGDTWKGTPLGVKIFILFLLFTVGYTIIKDIKNTIKRKNKEVKK